MPLAEFIVPLLVLDRLCNGNSNDEKAVINEFLAVFDFSEIEGLPGNETGKMSLSERQKAVNSAFMILDTLQHWAEKETEERYQSTRSSSVARSAQRKKEETASSDSNWLWEESISAIDRLLKAVPLSLQAKAAAAVGMHARALRLMEMAARAELVPSIYDTRVDKPEVSEQRRTDRSPGGQKVLSSHVIGTIDTYLLKQVLGQLNDCETMEGIANTSDAAPSALDDIMVKESKGEWSGALYDYERALELNESWSSRSSLEQGSLRCLLELGQLETVLYQVNGIVNRQPSGGSVERDLIESAPPNAIQAMPYAVEAAWRLGRWSTLTQILYDIDQKDTSRRRLNSDGIYRVALGSAMHGLHERSETQVASSIRKARHALMSDLSNVARDSYSRSYSYLVRLHCLREVENACEIMCAQETLNNAMRLGEIAASSGHEGWNWDGRLAMVAGSGSTDVVDVRLALSRLAGDAQLEGGLYLTVGKQARKNGLVNIAANFLSQAEACCSRQRLGLDDASGPLSHVDDLFSSIRLQSAKLKYQNGESTAALRILGLGNVSGMLESDDKSLQTIALAHERNAIPGCATNGRDQANDINRFSRRLLQSTRWMVEGGMKGGSEVIERFRIVQKLSPKWEKGKSLRFTSFCGFLLSIAHHCLALFHCCL
jgi:serine/threonine-protein kinase ATR